MKVTDKQASGIAKRQKDVQIAQQAMDSYMQGVADGLELDPNKKWNYDMGIQEFKEIKEK